MKPLLIALAVLFPFLSIAQKGDTITFYSNHDYKIESKDTAKYFTKQFKYFNRWVRYKYLRAEEDMIIRDVDDNADSAFAELNGMHVGYSNGYIIAKGAYKNGKKDGLWEFYYAKSTQKSMTAIFDDNTEPISYQCYNKDGSEKTKDCYYQKNSAFPEGIQAWMLYIKGGIEHVLRTKQKVLLKIGSGRYVAAVQFIVNADGSIIDAKIKSSSGQQELDQYALDIINQSKNWIPAILYGEVVKAYMIQPITFQIQ